MKQPFKQWVIQNYKTPDLMGHPSWQLALEIEAKWPDFPLTGSYLELAVWLSDHGACRRCLKAFKDAWDNYIND
jgi:hypothetical protein